jgi:hypothetical protein
VRFARVRISGDGEKRSWVKDEVAESSWVKRERSREVALEGGHELVDGHLLLKHADQILRCCVSCQWKRPRSRFRLKKKNI